MSLPVFDIIRGSFLDGPGIRTVVFLQGCPLRCVWCHNPESQDLHHFAEQSYTDEDLFDLLCRDLSYYHLSGGGVTFSGGEPLLHIKALKNLVQKLHQLNISIAFDTSGLFDYELFETELLPYTHILLFDLKVMDSQLHQRYTLQDNSRILQNLHKLRNTAINIRIRIPLVPQITITKKNLQAIAQQMKELGLQDYDLIPYNPSCMDKLWKMQKTPDPILQSTPMQQQEELLCKEIIDEILTEERNLVDSKL